MKFKTSRDKERGATLVEAAISYSLLFLALFAVVEFGLAFKDWMSVSQATREGARAGATFGNDLSADIKVLDGVEGALLPVGLKTGDQVTIFRANTVDENGSALPAASQAFTYQPSADCSGPYVDCCNWAPCPEIDRDSYPSPYGWPPNARDIDAPVTDRIGVSIDFAHDWITGFIGSGTLNFTVTTDFAIEPQLFKPNT